jgi:hypothetical protein
MATPAGAAIMDPLAVAVSAPLVTVAWGPAVAGTSAAYALQFRVSSTTAFSSLALPGAPSSLTLSSLSQAAYDFAVTATLNGGTTVSTAIASASNVVPTPAYSSFTLSSITANTYNLGFTRGASAAGTATLAVYDASNGGSPAATSKGAGSWTSAGAYVVSLSSGSSGTFVAPVDGHAYTAVLTDTPDALTLSTASTTKYAAPYDALALAAVTTTGYACSFTRNASATSSATLTVTDVSGNAAVGQYISTVSWAAAATSSYTVVVAAGDASGFVAPVSGHSYYFTLADATDDGFVVSSAAAAYTFVFTPSTIAGCTFWYDGADASRLTFSAGTTSVLAYADKSGAGNNATSLSAGTFAVGTLPVHVAATSSLTFSTSAMAVPGVSASMTADCTWVAVVQFTALSGNQSVMAGGTAPLTTSYGGCQMRLSGTGWNVNDGGHAGVLSASGISPQAANTMVLCSVQFTASGRALTLREYGHSIASATGVVAFQSGMSLLLGSRGASGPAVGESLVGSLYEVVAYSQNLNAGGEAGDYASLVNYLAAKWGFTVQA